MDKQTLIDSVNQLKREKNAVILAHNYQLPEVQDVADYFGDSLELARKAANTTADIIVFCGVRFMAETAKILSPEKKVILPREDALCPMAAMIDRDMLITLKRKYPEAKVVTYVNSTADVKAESDVCCTSANAVDITKNIDTSQIIFTPDQNLAAYCRRFTDKEIIAWDGYCYVHQRFSKDDVIRARRLLPEAAILAHPECPPEVIDEADETLSTSGMLRFAKNSSKKVFVIGTEEGLLYRLKKENPKKSFYALGASKICVNMKMTRLNHVYEALRDVKHEINLPESVMTEAKQSLDNMLRYG